MHALNACAAKASSSPQTVHHALVQAPPSPTHSPFPTHCHDPYSECIHALPAFSQRGSKLNFLTKLLRQNTHASDPPVALATGTYIDPARNQFFRTLPTKNFATSHYGD
jgi:hypothetical protein